MDQVIAFSQQHRVVAIVSLALIVLLLAVLLTVISIRRIKRQQVPQETPTEKEFHLRYIDSLLRRAGQVASDVKRKGVRYQGLNVLLTLIEVFGGAYLGVGRPH